MLDLLPCLPVFGIVARVALWGDHVRAGRGFSVFWRIDDSGPKRLQERYGQNIYAVRIAVI